MYIILLIICDWKKLKSNKNKFIWKWMIENLFIYRKKNVIVKYDMNIIVSNSNNKKIYL